MAASGSCHVAVAAAEGQPVLPLALVFLIMQRCIVAGAKFSGGKE